MRLPVSLLRGALPFFFVLLLVFVFAGEAEACSCAANGAPCQEFWQADAVFTGTVVGGSKVKTGEGEAYTREMRLVRLSVLETFRGETAAQVEVVTGWGDADCGYGFKTGRAYLVYAHRSEKDGRLYTGICTRTSPLSEAGEDLAYIRALPTADAGATVFGKVAKRNHRRGEGEQWSKPVADALLTIEGGGNQQEARTDAAGDFRFKGLAPGEYQVKLKLPPGLTDGRASDGLVTEKVKVVARGCGELFFLLDADTRVGGRVIDYLGQPVPNLPVQLRGAPSDSRNINTFIYAETDAEGRFEFKTVPPGDYLLGVRILGWSGSREPIPYPRTYYPGVASKAAARVVSVREGEVVRGLELRLPPRLGEHGIEGMVVWADGRPAPGATVYLSLQEEGETAEAGSARADERGRFTLKIFEGLTYRASAYLQEATGANAQSEWIEIPPPPLAAPLKIILPVRKSR